MMPGRSIAMMAASPMLINCVAYQNGRKLADIPIEDISDYVSRPDCFVWVALFEPDDDELDEMARGVRPARARRRGRAQGPPAAEDRGVRRLAVRRAAHGRAREPPDGTRSSSIGEVDVFVGRNYVLSVRHRTQKGFADVRARTEREPDLLRHGSGFVFYALMDTVVDRYFPILDALEIELEQLEEQIFARDADAREHRGALRR